jgi:hypothetical protein
MSINRDRNRERFGSFFWASCWVLVFDPVDLKHNSSAISLDEAGLASARVATRLRHNHRSGKTKGDDVFLTQSIVTAVCATIDASSNRRASYLTDIERHVSRPHAKD